MTFRVETFKGIEAEPYIRRLSEMRITEFCQFPYLYMGNVADDLLYTRQVSLSPQGMLVVAFKDDTIAGMRSGLPMRENQSKDWEKALQQFEKKGIKIRDYYCGCEIIVHSDFRRMGLGSQLMTRFIKEIKAMEFPGVTDITVIRAPDHPLRPQNYGEMEDAFLPKFGFKKSPVILAVKYPTRQSDGSIREEENDLVCWVNTFEA